MAFNHSIECDGEFGDRIRFIRTLLKLTQKQLAGKIGLKSSIAIYQYEKQLRMPDRAKVLLISEAGNTTSQWLLNGKVDFKACDKIKDSISLFYANDYQPLGFAPESINALPIEILVEKAAKRLDVPAHYLLFVIRYDIDPSPNFIRHFCRNFSLQIAEFGASASGSDFPDRQKPDRQGSLNTSEPKGEEDPLRRINDLLLHDEEARPLVLEILLARRKIRTATATLRKETNNLNS